MNELDMFRQQNQMQHDSQVALQEQANQAQQVQYAPQLREAMAESQAAVIAQTDPTKALKAVLEGFKGNAQNEHGEFVEFGTPLMNQKGLSTVASFLTPIMNDSTRFGDIPAREVRDMTEDIVNQITEDLGLNWKEYGISDISKVNIIIADLIPIVRITLSRSEEGGERQFLSKVVLESIGAAKQQKKKESGWLKNMFSL